MAHKSSKTLQTSATGEFLEDSSVSTEKENRHNTELRNLRILYLNEAVEMSSVSIIQHCYSVAKCHSYGCEHEVIIKALSK